MNLLKIATLASVALLGQHVLFIPEALCQETIEPIIVNFTKLSQANLRVISQPAKFSAVAIQPKKESNFIQDLNATAVVSLPPIKNPADSAQIKANPQTLLTFTGQVTANTIIPADPSGAVGTSHILTCTNEKISIHTHAGQLVSSLTDEFFWGVEQNLGSAAAITKMQCVFDKQSLRFFCIAQDGEGSTTSNLLVAVSETSDPTGNWYQYRFQANAESSDYYLQHPILGLSYEWVVGIGKIYSSSLNSFIKNKAIVLRKSQLLAGGSVTSYELSINDGNHYIAPAVVHDADANYIPMLASVNSHTLRYYKIQGTTTPQLATVGDIDFGTNNAWFYENYHNNAEPQMGMWCLNCGINSDNDNFKTSLVMRNNKVWAAHTVFKSNTGSFNYNSRYRGTIQWYCLNAGTGSVVEWGQIEDPTFVNYNGVTVPQNSFGYPAIGVNANEDIAIAFSHFSPYFYPSAAFIVKKRGESNFRKVNTYKKGLEYYFKTYGGANNQWGYTSAVAVESTNDREFWVLGCYSETTYNENRWGVRWGKFDVCPSELNFPSYVYLSGTSTRSAAANTGKIIAENDIAATARITYEAPVVILNPGFSATPATGGVFQTAQGGCTD